MKKAVIMAYRIVEIDELIYLVVFPIPSKEEIEKKDFSYPKYIKKLLVKLKKTSPSDRKKILDQWAMPIEENPYDNLIAEIQKEYEKELHNGLDEKMISDIYTERMKKITEEYKNIEEKKKAIQELLQRKKKLEQIKRTSEDRIASVLDGTTEIKELYLFDLKKMNKNKKQREFKRMFFGRIDIGIQDELTELELETMTLQEIWHYNKSYLEKRAQKRKIKTP